MVNSVSGVITILTMILSCVKMIVIAIPKKFKQNYNSAKIHKLWWRCPRPLDSPTSLSESEREAERTISRFSPICLSFCWIAIEHVIKVFRVKTIFLLTFTFVSATIITYNIKKGKNSHENKK